MISLQHKTGYKAKYILQKQKKKTCPKMNATSCILIFGVKKISFLIQIKNILLHVLPVDERWRGEGKLAKV